MMRHIATHHVYIAADCHYYGYANQPFAFIEMQRRYRHTAAFATSPGVSSALMRGNFFSINPLPQVNLRNYTPQQMN